MKIAICGYGNLGRGVEAAITKQSDMELFGVFTRRDPSSVKTLTGAKAFSTDDIANYKNDIDVVIICGGSATDLPVMTPELAKDFNVVDSFDTHAKIPEHFENVDKAAKSGNNTALISGGWDPGLFSLARAYADSILPDAKSYTFWGRGVSQGHSDAVRRIEGVLDARQYTVPVEAALEAVRSGSNPELTTRQKHTRECFVVLKPEYDNEKEKARITKEIVTMPNYFDEYDTSVTFITEAEMKEKHSGLPHGGSVISAGKTGLDNENTQTIEFKLNLDSNPQFTSSVLVALARAVYKKNKKGDFGCKTIFDVSVAEMSPKNPEDLRRLL